MIREYYRLAKPGMVYGNALTALAAFLFASRGAVDFRLLAATLAGLSLAIASACVLNNIIDRDIDARMERTKERAIPTGRISARSAGVYAAALGIFGFGLLFLFTNLYAVLATAFGVIVYVGVYTPLKRRTLHSTIVGALAGAVPPVVGYAAVAHAYDATALCLFLILVTWQMTHFFAIGIYRLDEYRAAGIPIMPAVIGIRPTKAAMLAHAIAFTLAVFALAAVHATSVAYLLIMGILSIGWLAFALAGFAVADSRRWARRSFFYSLFLLVGFCVALVISSGGA